MSSAAAASVAPICHDGDRTKAEEQGDDRRHEQLAGNRPGQLERGVRAAAAGSERDEGHLHEHRADCEPRRAEHRAAHLEGEHERERREDARLVQHDGRRVDAAELCDEREPAVPERKRVAGMQPAVLELVDRAERQRAEARPASGCARGGRGRRRARRLRCSTARCRARRRRARRARGSAIAHRRRGRARRENGSAIAPAIKHERERQIERAVDGEGDRERPRHECTRPGERTDRAGAARARARRAGPG